MKSLTLATTLAFGLAAASQNAGAQTAMPGRTPQDVVLSNVQEMLQVTAADDYVILTTNKIYAADPQTGKADTAHLKYATIRMDRYREKPDYFVPQLPYKMASMHFSYADSSYIFNEESDPKKPVRKPMVSGVLRQHATGGCAYPRFKIAEQYMRNMYATESAARVALSVKRKLPKHLADGGG